jgi:hypothetical protein
MEFGLARGVDPADDLGVAVDAHGLGADHGRDALGAGEEGRVADHACRRAQQLLALREQARDIVGVAARGHGQLGGLLQEDDLRVLVQASGPGRGLGSGGGASDDDDTFGNHGMLLGI